MGKATVVVAIEGADLGQPWPGQTWSRRAVEELQEDPAVTVAEVNGKLVATKTLAAPVQRWEYVEVRGLRPCKVTYCHPDEEPVTKTLNSHPMQVVRAQLQNGWEPCGIARDLVGCIRAFRRRVQ